MCSRRARTDENSGSRKLRVIFHRTPLELIRKRIQLLPGNVKMGARPKSLLTYALEVNA